jgi:hypothetical protein
VLLCIFFNVDIVREIWKEIMRKCDLVGPPTSWDDVLTRGLRRWRKKSLKANIRTMICGLTLYNI